MSELSGTSKPRRATVEERLYHLLSDGSRFGNNDKPPGTGARFEFGEHSWPEVATTYNDDGAVLWIGTKDNWHTNFGRHDAHRLAWFILWDWWLKGEWLGFRRWAWFKLLHRRVASYRRMP